MLRPGTKWPDKGLHQVVHWQYSANLMKSLHAHMHRLALRTWFESGITLYYTFNLSTSRGHDPGVRTSRLVYTCRYLVCSRILNNFLRVPRANESLARWLRHQIILSSQIKQETSLQLPRVLKKQDDLFP